VEREGCYDGHTFPGRENRAGGGGTPASGGRGRWGVLAMSGQGVGTPPPSDPRGSMVDPTNFFGGRELAHAVLTEGILASSVNVAGYPKEFGLKLNSKTGSILPRMAKRSFIGGSNELSR